MKLLDAILLFVLGLIVWELIDPGEMTGFALNIVRQIVATF